MKFARDEGSKFSRSNRRWCSTLAISQTTELNHWLEIKEQGKHATEKEWKRVSREERLLYTIRPRAKSYALGRIFSACPGISFARKREVKCIFLRLTFPFFSPSAYTWWGTVLQLIFTCFLHLFKSLKKCEFKRLKERFLWRTKLRHHKFCAAKTVI